MRRWSSKSGSASSSVVPDDFLIARNPEEDSTLPYLLRIPLGPDDAEIIDRIPVRYATTPFRSRQMCERQASIFARSAAVSPSTEFRKASITGQVCTTASGPASNPRWLDSTVSNSMRGAPVSTSKP